MSLENIDCKCPECGVEFTLDKAIGEQTLSRVQDELSKLSNKKIQEKIDAATRIAVEEGKKLARGQMLEEAKKTAAELGNATTQLTKLELEKLRLEGEKSNLETNQQAAINLALQKQENEFKKEKNQEITELELRISTLKKDMEKVSSRAQQGSMQAQGEASELLIESTLANLFPRDEVTEIKKGAQGADCILTVKNSIGRPVGKICIESKQTKNFSKDWINKLRDDSLSVGAHFSVLVTNAWPSDNKSAHMRDGVWVCGFDEYQILIRALRNSLIELAKATAAEGAREEKSQIMFDFLTSPEFAGTIEQMIGPILRMQEQLKKEKNVFGRIWKEREALIDGSISGAENLYYKIQGIAQVNLPSIKGLDSLETFGYEMIDEASTDTS